MSEIKEAALFTLFVGVYVIPSVWTYGKLIYTAAKTIKQERKNHGGLLYIPNEKYYETWKELPAPFRPLWHPEKYLR